MTCYDCTDEMFNGSIPLLAAMHLGSNRWDASAIIAKEGEIGTFDDDDPSKPVLRLESAADLKKVDAGELTIRVELKHGLMHRCSCCGGPAAVKTWVTTSYDTAPINGMKTTLEVTSPQIYCESCSKYSVVPCPAVRTNCTHTKELEIQVLKCLLDGNFTQTAERMQTSHYIVTKILKRAVEDGLERRILGPVTEIYVDEVYFGVRNGEEIFVTVFSDQNHEVLHLTKDHTQGCMKEMRDLLLSNRRDPNEVKYISMDMAKPFKAGAEKYFRKARIVLDRFHLMKNINEALEKVRKRTYRELSGAEKKELGRIKFTVLYNAENLPEKHKERLESIRLLIPELALAYDLKEEFRLIFDCKTREEGKAALIKWYNRVLESGIAELITKANSIMERIEDVLPWFEHRISNGVAEGINNKLQKIKSDAYGFRCLSSFMNLAYFRKAKIPISI